MKLSRIHFKAIADTLKMNKPRSHWDPNKMAQWMTTVRDFADMCSRTNSAFKRERFLEACDYHE
jgi:hypothetical protein